MNRHKVLDWGASAGVFLAHIGNYIYMPLLLSLLGGKYNGFCAGFVLFMTYVGRVSATFCYTSISQQFALRNVISTFIVLEGAALLGMGFTSSILMYSILAFFVGFGSGVSFPALKHLLSNLPESLRVAAFSRFQLAAQGGLVVGALMGGFWSTAKMQSVFTVTFLLFLGYASVILMAVPLEKKLPNIITKRKIVDFSLLQSARFSEIKYDLIMSMFYWILVMSFMVNMPLHIQSYLPALSISMPFWITGLILLIFQMPLSKLASKYLDNSLTMIFGCLALLCGFVLFSISFSLMGIILGCIGIALGQILFAPALDLQVAKSVSKENMAQAMSAMHFYRSFGNMIGTFCAGILFDLGNSLHQTNLSWISMALLASLLVAGAIVLASKRYMNAQQPA